MQYSTDLMTVNSRNMQHMILEFRQLAVVYMNCLGL